MEKFKKRVITYFRESGTRPLSIQEIEDALDLTEVSDFKLLKNVLNELEKQGDLVKTHKNRYGLPENMNLIREKVEMNKKGLAFIIPEDEELHDINVHSNEINTAINDDTDLVRLNKEGYTKN